MKHEECVINEIRRIPIITAVSAIGPYLQLRRKDTDEFIKLAYSLNVSTGECLMPMVDPAGQFKRDENEQIIMQTVYLDLKDFYLAFTAK